MASFDNVRVLQLRLCKISLVFILLNFALICHVGGFGIIREQTMNRTKLLSYFVLTCGSSAGFCNQSLSPFHIEPVTQPFCALGLGCDAGCALSETCAPDAPMAYVNVSCISTTIYPLEERYQSNSYNMIAQCGISQTNNNVNNLCTDIPKRSMTNLHDDIFKPVFSKSSHMIYRNVYCASCNDDPDIISFELEVTCPHVFDINTFSNLHKAWNSIYLNNCTVYYKPPEEYSFSIRTCSQENNVDRCNVTGLWSPVVFDSQIEWACENFNSYAYKGYKNIYCYICNPSLVAFSTTKLVSSCNITGEYSNTELIVEQGCYTLPATPRTAPFKNIFCKLCNGVDDEQDFAERRFNDFTVVVRNPYNTDPEENGFSTTFWDLQFDEVDPGGFTHVKAQQEILHESAIKQRLALEELGRLCGYESFCEKPFRYLYSTFEMCSFPCAENFSCCLNLSSGIDPGTLLPNDFYFSLQHSEDSHIHFMSEFNVGNATNESYNTGEDFFSVIGTCGNIHEDNQSEIVHKCERPSFADVLSYIPVTSDRDHADYRNVYCARCNGDFGRLRSLGFRAYCGKSLEGTAASSFEDVQRSITAGKCKIVVETLTDICKQNPECVRTCRKPVPEIYISSNVSYMCENAHLTYSLFPSVELNGTVYKNVFCFLCNMQFNGTSDDDTINQCNQTGLWDMNEYTVLFENLCSDMPAHSAWYPFKNVFCASCNMKTSYFKGFSEDMTSCTGIECILMSTYRGVFSFSPPSPFVASSIIGRTQAEICPLGKTMVDGICRPLIEDTTNLAYDIDFGLRIMISDLEVNISVLNLLEILRQQVTDQLLSESNDSILISSVVVSVIKQCTDVVQIKKFVDDLEHISDHEYLIEAHLFIGKTRNRTLLENYLNDSRNNRSFQITVENGYVTLNSYEPEEKSVCVNASMRQQNKGCVISEFEHRIHIPENVISLRVNKLLFCNLKTLRNSDKSLIEDLCSKGLPFDYDSGTKIVKVCRSDLSQIANNAGNQPQHLPIMDTLIYSHGIFSFVCTCFSLLCLILTFITYALFKSIRTIPGINNMNLVLTLFGAQIFTQFGLWQTAHRSRCVILGIITHYFWLSTFCAMNVCSFHMFRVFASLMYSSHFQSKWTSLRYCLYIYVAPALVILLYGIIKVSVDGSEYLGYGGSVCFLSEVVPIVTLVITPAGTIIIMNAVFSGLAYWRIRSTPHVQSNSDRNELKIYIKLLTVTGIAWPLIFIDALLPLSMFSFVATFANALQGVFIFLAFICNKKVLYLYRSYCCKHHIYSSANDTQMKSTTETTM